MHRALWAFALVCAAALLLGRCSSGDNPYLCEDPTCGDAGPDAGPDAGGDAGCTETWTCSYWQATDAGTATRSCIDVAGCGTNNQRPSEGPVALPALDLNYYKCNVQPVVARSCAMVGCHGTLSTDRAFRAFARGRQRNNEVVAYTPSTYGCGAGATVNINLSVEASGTASCPAKIRLTNTEWQLNFDQMRVFALGTGGSMATSELLTQPTKSTSFAHAGIKVWTSSSPEYQTVLNWLNGSTLSTCNTGSN